MKSILSDNILLGDIYLRAKELHFVSEVPRAVFLIRQEGADVSVIDVVQGSIPTARPTMSSPSARPTVASGQQVTETTNAKDLYKIAKGIEETVSSELKIKVVIGIGTMVNHVRDLARAYNRRPNGH